MKLVDTRGNGFAILKNKRAAYYGEDCTWANEKSISARGGNADSFPGPVSAARTPLSYASTICRTE